MSLTKVSYSMIAGAPVNVLDYGASPSASASVNTVAMQAAHDTGRIVYYPAGIYVFTKLTTPIYYGGIIGDGPTLTILKSTDTTSSNLFVFNGRWENYNLTQNNSAFVFRDFSVTSQTSNTGGAAIQITAPIAGTQRENQITFFENVLFRDVWIGIDFAAASFWKVIGCNFINHLKAGVQVANAYNADSGDSAITNCIFETNASSSNICGVLQFSSGGLKITGCKFLGGTYGYRMEWNGADSSNLQICNNSFELSQYGAISLTRASGTATFKLITITGNEIALTTTGITSDSNTWLSQVTIVGNVIELWGGYSSTTNAIGFNYLSNFFISSNNLTGTGTTSTGISLFNPTNGQIGLNNYLQFSAPIAQSGSTPAVVQLSTQSGQANTAASGWSVYGNLFLSSATSVTFTTPFITAPNVWDISLTAGDGTRAVSGIVNSVTTTGFSFSAIAISNSGAATIYWAAKGLI
jgi:hypothetical protein